MTMCDVFVQDVLDHWFMFGTPTSLTGDTTVYLGLSTADPLDDGSGIVEPATSDGYARINIGDTSSILWEILIGRATNLSQIIFPLATGSWGTITHWFISTSGTRGVAPDRFFNSIGTPILVGGSSQLLIPVNFFDIGTVDAGAFFNLHSTAYVDDQILKHMLRNTAATVANTFCGIHSFPFLPSPKHSGPRPFGEVWDAVANTGYTRTGILKGDQSFPGFTSWDNPKDGEVENLGFFNIPQFFPVTFGFSSKFIIILDAEGVDPGGGSEPGSGGGNLLFWSQRSLIASFPIGDHANIDAGELDISLD